MLSRRVEDLVCAFLCGRECILSVGLEQGGAVVSKVAGTGSPGGVGWIITKGGLSVGCRCGNGTVLVWMVGRGWAWLRVWVG